MLSPFIAELCAVIKSGIIGVTPLRIRILKTLTGVIDGHGLSQYHPGDVYDVSESFGLQLIEMNAAIEVRSTDPTAATTDDDVDVGRLTGGVHVVPPDTADDRPERRTTADRRRTTRTDRRN